MLRVLLVGCAIGLLGLVACSGSDGDSDDRVLELRGYDITEQDYQTTIRLRFLNPLDASVCDSLVGLSPEDVVELATLEIETTTWELKVENEGKTIKEASCRGEGTEVPVPDRVMIKTS